MRGAPHPSMTGTFHHHVYSSSTGIRTISRENVQILVAVCTGTTFIRLVGILLFRGKFQLLAAKETAYVRAAGTPPISLVGNRGKRSSFGSQVTVHAETVTDDERDLPLMHAQFVFSSTCSPSVRKPYVCQ